MILYYNLTCNIYDSTVDFDVIYIIYIMIVLIYIMYINSWIFEYTRILNYNNIITSYVILI